MRRAAMLLLFPIAATAQPADATRPAMLAFQPGKGGRPGLDRAPPDGADQPLLAHAAFK